MIVFVLVVNTLAVGELAELLRQLRTSDLSILLIPEQWFESKKGDSNISKLPFPSFPLLAPNSWCGYLFLILKNSVCWDGFRTDFFRFMIKSRCCSRKINVSWLIKISCNVLPIRRISSRYVTRRMVSGFSRAIGTFNSFENILGAGPNPK